MTDRAVHRVPLLGAGETCVFVLWLGVTQGSFCVCSDVSGLGCDWDRVVRVREGECVSDSGGGVTRGPG